MICTYGVKSHGEGAILKPGAFLQPQEKGGWAGKRLSLDFLDCWAHARELPRVRLGLGLIEFFTAAMAGEQPGWVAAAEPVICLCQKGLARGLASV